MTDSARGGGEGRVAPLADRRTIIASPIGSARLEESVAHPIDCGDWMAESAMPKTPSKSVGTRKGADYVSCTYLKARRRSRRRSRCPSSSCGRGSATRRHGEGNNNNNRIAVNRPRQRQGQRFVGRSRQRKRKQITQLNAMFE